MRCVQGAVEFEQFLDDVALGDSIALWGRVRDRLENVDIEEHVEVGTDGLTYDAGVRGELRLVELRPGGRSSSASMRIGTFSCRVRYSHSLGCWRRASLVSRSSTGDG